MKKVLYFLLISSAFNSNAMHYFNLCYYNWTNHDIDYNNNGIRYKWKNSGELIGNGVIKENTHKCFKTSDETMFVSHYITVYINNNWYGIRHPWYANPYVISEKATAKKGGKLIHSVTKNGQDSYDINIHFLDNNEVRISSSNDPKDIKSYIEPRFFK
jgi:hypothetical protein